MLLSEILTNLEYECDGFRDSDISDIVYDSRLARGGTLFVALRGAFTDGHDYAESAYLHGARYFLAERILALPEDARVIVTSDTRAALAVISGNFFSHPDREMKIIGVTGTKGKTTVTHMLKTVLTQSGIESGVIGTVGAYYKDKFIPTVNTTPESYENMKLMRLMADDGVKAVCMEVSSLGLKNHRVDGIHFDTAVFTNLSPDHIGGAEHESFEEYAYWKKQLFKNCSYAVLNADDIFSAEIEKELDCPFLTYAIDEKADVCGKNAVRLREKGIFGVGFTCCTDGKEYPCRVAMPGFYSVYNALAALAVCRRCGTDMKNACAALEKARVKGRNEVIPVEAPFDVIIDYAHNGTSMKNIIETVREYEHNRIITVFGSVGDRAQLRRREMGLVSGAMSDISIITSDDPGFEEPMAIAEEIAGFVKQAGGEYEIICDRANAVARALSLAREHDIVLLLGKGHETAQKVMGEKLHYSDHEQTAAYFNGKREAE